MSTASKDKAESAALENEKKSDKLALSKETSEYKAASIKDKVD